MKQTIFPSLVNELEEALLPYEGQCKNWLRSQECFMEDEEITAMETYLKRRTFEEGGNESDTTEVMFYITIKNCITKLNLFRALMI